MNKHVRTLLVVILLALTLVACQATPTPTPVPISANTATSTATGTATPAPTSTARPSPTNTATPTPTNTTAPTSTPVSPTPTPVPPTSTLTPVPPTPTNTPVKVSISAEVHCNLTGDLASRNLVTIFHADVQSDKAAQVAVQTPSGEIVVLPPFGDVFGWERRFHGGIQEPPQAGGTYVFTALDADGAPIAGAVASDVYIGGYEPDPPTNVQAQMVEAGLLITWDPSPAIAGGFDPSGSPPLGSYLIHLYREEGGEQGGSTYGWTQAGKPLPETSHLIPFHHQDFGPGDTGLALEEMDDGAYYLNLVAFSVAPGAAEEGNKECMAHDPAQNIRIVIEGGQVRIEGP
jgi:hypothetical protein